MNMTIQTVGIDTMSEIASAIVERRFYKTHTTGNHSFTDTNGDIRYIEEVQDDFNTVLDIIDSILNPEF
jgi:hypothetical protein